MRQVRIDTAFQRRMIKNVAFFGDANIGESDPTYKDAFEIAKTLAEAGYVIVNGGGPGVMNASTQGAEAGKGETLSVTFETNDAPGFEGKYLANITDKEIKTTNYIERMFKLIQHGDIFIMFKGGTGTVSEFGTAWVLAKLYYGHHKPFILYGKFWREIVKALSDNLNIDKQELSVFEIVDKREEVLPAVEKLQRELSWGKR
ncbi:MAG: hypothetical protein UV74_C0001G0021 [Candidatus Woesebacteria bacterium GW2011_GWB1_43_14]|uniref:Rossmann fold nucleotide-binding protein n=1 Tax=Candidatus Woesebacteria bacterium GW2011_GWB1_43_14 TaxID=1618578 RepID=A0A0G1FV88_9BACT|nr:MAG: hypothetical protein UV51_C0002G0010 [Candidatus Woesebacteria bacterium GW2011_GWC1_42_9]KKS98911.1 MAG: hypothetical protein UV74_C0001G0021 [Candidatus Woesebacteria bacterium GW2011_GWB1_43_14]